MLARAPASPAQGLHHPGTSVFQFSMRCGLGKFGLVDQNYLGRALSALLLRTLGAGRRQESGSIEVRGCSRYAVKFDEPF